MAKDLFEGTDLLASGPRDLFADESNSDKFYGDIVRGFKQGLAGLGNTVDQAFSGLAAAIQRPGNEEESNKTLENLLRRKASRNEFARTEKELGLIPGLIGKLPTLPGQILTFPLSPFQTGQDMIDAGESLGKAQAGQAITGATNAAAMALPLSLGANVLVKGATGAGSNLANTYVQNKALNALSDTEESKKRYDPKLKDYAEAGVLGMGFGLLGPTTPLKNPFKKKVTPSKDFSAIVGEEPLSTSVAKPIDVLDARLEHPLAAEARVREQNMKQPSADDYNNRDANARAVEEEIAAMAEAEAAFKAEQDAAESARLNEFAMKAQQDVIDATPHGERPAQYGMTDTGGRVDENGIPIRADLSMEAQNLQDPLQRNLWGDELSGRSQDSSIGMTQALDKMPESAARDQAISQLSGVPRSLESHVQDILNRGLGGKQRGAIDLDAFRRQKEEQEFALGKRIPVGEVTEFGIEDVTPAPEMRSAPETIPMDQPKAGAPRDLSPFAADIGNVYTPTDGFRGMGRGQRGALNFGKQMPSSDELTLSKVVRPPDSVTHPISPETIAIKQDLAAKANAVNLKDTPYGRVTTLEEAVAGISKDTDINKSYTGIRDKTVSGVETMLRFKPKNRVLNFVRSIFQESRNLHEEWSKEFLTGESGINSALTKLSSQEKVDVVSLLIALDKKQKPLSPEILAKAGFTENQAAAATRIREAFDFLYQQKGAALGEQGYDPHYYRQGYVPANFSGAYKTLVGHYSKDGSFVITGIAQADTAYGHKKAVDYYKELGGDKFSVFVPIKREGYRTSSALGSAHDSWATLVSQLAKHDPEFAKVKAIADQRGADAAASLYDYHLHEKKKSGVQGSLGDRPWLSPERNAKEFISGMVDYLEEGFRYTAYQKPLNDTTKLLTNPKLQEEMPNTATFVEQYKRHIMGQNLHPVGAGLNWAVDSLAKSLFVGNGKLARVNQELTHWSSVHMMGMLNAGFFAMQLTQLATGGVPELMAIRAQIGGHPETVAKSLTSTITSLSALSAEKVLGKEVDVAPHMREAYDWAHKNGLFTFSEAELAHQVLQSKARKRIDAVATAPIRYGEQATRPAVFMMFTDMFHQNGYTGEQGRLMAQTATDFAMANYHPDERPMLYQSLGVVGSLVGALSTYKHNFVSQHIARAKNAKEIPAAGAAMLGLGFALYGLGGMPGSQELSWLSEKVTGKTLRENLLTEPRKANDWYDGLLTASTGLDFQNRLSNAQVLPDASMSALPHLSNFLSIGQKAYEFAVTQDKGSFQDLAIATTPAGMRGITEMSIYPDGNILDKKTGETRYENPRSTKEQVIRAATGVRPFSERLQDERVYANRKQEAIRQDKLKKAQTNFDRAYLLDDGAGMDKAYEAYIKEDGNPQTLWDSKRLQNLLKEAGKSEEERRAGTPRDINSLRRYEDFTR